MNTDQERVQVLGDVVVIKDDQIRRAFCKSLVVNEVYREAGGHFRAAKVRVGQSEHYLP